MDRMDDRRTASSCEGTKGLKWDTRTPARARAGRRRCAPHSKSCLCLCLDRMAMASMEHLTSWPHAIAHFIYSIEPMRFSDDLILYMVYGTVQ